MKRFLIIASMVCLLVSSLVVVSFADEVSVSEESRPYNYITKLAFTNLPDSVSSDIYYSYSKAFSGKYEVVVDSDVYVGEFTSYTMEIDLQDTTYLNVNYNFVSQETGDEWSFRFRYSDGVFHSFRPYFNNDYLKNYRGVDNVDIVIYSDVELNLPLIDNGILNIYRVRTPNPPITDIFYLMFTNFGVAISGLALGIKESLSNVIWVDPSVADRTLSPLVTFIFTIAGLGIGMTVFYMVFRLIRFGRQR